jgi:hypothetical protein
MFQKRFWVSIISLIISLLPSNIQVAGSTEILWNPGVSNSLPNASSGLVPGAGIKNTGLLVYKANPDELIMKIIMSESFEDKPFSGKGRNMAMWIYWPKDYCWVKNSANCEGLFLVPHPVNPASYPTTKSSEYVFVDKHDKASNVNIKATECKAPWWIESTFKSRDTWAFAVSITCLGIPKEFGWYAYSKIDLGQKDVVSDFTDVQTITYPFHDLAASAYKESASSENLKLLQDRTSFLQEAIDKTKRLLKKSKLKDKNLLLQQLDSLSKQQGNTKKILDNLPTVRGNLSEVINSYDKLSLITLKQINALRLKSKLSVLSFNDNGLKSISSATGATNANTAASFTAFLDKPIYIAGEVATLVITAKDSSGKLIGSGLPIANSNSDFVINFNPDTFVNIPKASDTSINGQWTYKFTISPGAGNRVGKVKLPNLPEQSVAYGVR